MDDTIIHISKLELSGLKEKIDPKSYVECGKCGAILLKAMDLVKKLYDTERVFKEVTDYDSDNRLNPFPDDIFPYPRETASEILETLTGYKYQLEIRGNWCREKEDWKEWYQENSERICTFIPNDFDEPCVVFLKYSNVVLYSDRNCSCFITYKEKRH